MCAKPFPSIHTHTHTHTFRHMHMHSDTHTHMHTHTHIHTHTNTHTYTHTLTNTHTHTHSHTHTHTQTHTSTHTHTQTHARTYTHTPLYPPLLIVLRTPTGAVSHSMKSACYRLNIKAKTIDLPTLRAIERTTLSFPSTSRSGLGAFVFFLFCIRLDELGEFMLYWMLLKAFLCLPLTVGCLVLWLWLLTGDQ